MTFYHVGKNDAKVRNVISLFDLDINPKITAERAALIAKSVAGNLGLAHDPILKILPSKTNNSARLIYLVNLSSEDLNNPGAEVLIDAQTGKLIANISKLETLATVQVSTAQKQGVIVSALNQKDTTRGCREVDMANGEEAIISQDDCNSLLQVAQNECQIVMGGSGPSSSPVSLDPKFCKNVVDNNEPTAEADQSSINALNNAKKVLAYYKEIHGRDSFDNKGSSILSLVHVGINYANAAWVADKNFMLYGDGDGKRMGDMTKAVDIAGHEMTHGVISQTAKLSMMGEPGALNEAYADFFGKMIAQDGTWILGASVSISSKLFPGIRNMENPNSFQDIYPDQRGFSVHGSYPSKVSEMVRPLRGTVCGDENDCCWVHHNSTIPSHASYLIHQAIGKAKTEALYYLTLTQFLTSESDFKEAAGATLEACKMLINQKHMTSADCSTVKNVFTQVGML
ncbi:MAG: M4 family metallopeptidase, partial [Bacteriovoracales bacterium]